MVSLLSLQIPRDQALFKTKLASGYRTLPSLPLLPRICPDDCINSTHFQMCYHQLQRDKQIRYMELFCFVSSFISCFLVLKMLSMIIFHELVKKHTSSQENENSCIQKRSISESVHFQKIVWFIGLWPAVYQVLTERILETKDRSLIFHKNGKKMKGESRLKLPKGCNYCK